QPRRRPQGEPAALRRAQQQQDPEQEQQPDRVPGQIVPPARGPGVEALTSVIGELRSDVTATVLDSRRILITGDAGFETEMELLERRADVAADLWIMGRHESDYTAATEFVQAVAPTVIVATEEHYPPEERIPRWWAEAMAEEGIDLWRQGETGAVMIEVGDGELEIRSFLNPEKERVLRK
ncbi:MAG: hypothetical protein GY953_49190, partial [bacterium]|nr:hypothetical protein [bacterium]